MTTEKNTIYRVVAETTESVQPGGSFWSNEVLYCGSDRTEARRVYHESEPLDFGGSPGNRCRRTVMQAISDACTDDAADDEVETMDVS